MSLTQGQVQPLAAGITTDLQDALTAASDFAGSVVAVTLNGAGEVVIALDTVANGSFQQVLAGDLGLPGLGLDGGGAATVDATLTYVTFGIVASGFFFDSSSGKEVGRDLSVTDLALFSAMDLGGQGYEVTEAGSGFTAAIGVNLTDADNRLTAGQMSTVTVAASLTGTADLAIGMTIASAGDMTPPVTATLTVGWEFDGATINPDDTNVAFGDRPVVAFSGITMDLGTFVEDMVAPLATRITDMIDPIRPLIDILTTSINLLENLPGGIGMVFDTDGDGQLTFLDLLVFAFSNANLDGFLAFVELADQILDWADFLTNTAFAKGDLALGDFNLGSADIRSAGFDLQTAIATFGGLAGDLTSVVNGLTGAGWSTTDTGSGLNRREVLQEILGSSAFDLPILTNPAQ